MRDVLERFHRLSPADQSQLDTFDCGDPEMNYWLSHRALSQQRQRFNETHLINSEDGGICPGFVSLSAASITREATGLSGWPYPIAPALFIARLAVHLPYQEQGIGKTLVQYTLLVPSIFPIGCRYVALEVEDTNERAIRLYERQGFRVPPAYESDTGRLLYLYDLGKKKPADEAGGSLPWLTG